LWRQGSKADTPFLGTRLHLDTVLLPERALVATQDRAGFFPPLQPGGSSALLLGLPAEKRDVLCTGSAGRSRCPFGPQGIGYFVNEGSRDYSLRSVVGTQQSVIADGVNQPRETLGVPGNALNGRGGKQILAVAPDRVQPVQDIAADFLLPETLQLTPQGNALVELTQPGLGQLSR
jgi:hypothetical protein